VQELAPADTPAKYHFVALSWLTPKTRGRRYAVLLFYNPVMDSLLRDAQQLFNIDLTDDQVKRLITYERELLDWNQKFNLTAIRDVESIRTKHFLDSFSCTLAWKSEPPGHLVDVGTGAGFPGIPLKIIYPEMHLTLVESIGKKAKFCEHMVDTLGLKNVRVVTSRAEDFAQKSEQRESYDWAVARAVANMSVLSEYLLPLVQVGGHMLAQKGENAREETQAAEKAIKLLGGKLKELIPVRLPGIPEDRYLVVVDKVEVTPKNYPRKAGTPSKTPL
jgi:16S rRNA (guanine527-N7)-methyltransferase